MVRKRFRAALCALALGLIVGAPTPAHAATDAGKCLAEGNVLVVVQADTGPAKTGCATKFSTGMQALTSAGFSVEDLSGFVCRIDGAPGECSYDTVWWSYWTRTAAGDKWDDWTMSPLGATQSKPVAGSVEGWHLVPLRGGLEPPAIDLPAPPTQPGPEPGDPVVTIPDAGFRGCLATALGQGPSAPIRESQLAGLTEVSCFFAGISSLDGAEHLTGLVSLDLTFNAVTDLTPLAGLTELRELILDGNQVAGLTPLAGLTGLRTLDLDDNQVSDLTPLAGLRNLTDLSVSEQRAGGKLSLTSLAPLAGLPLTRLDASSNAVTDLTALSGIGTLKELLLYSNGLSNLTPLGGLTGLEKLNLHSNQLNSISALSGLTSLRELNLRTNQVASVAPLRSLTALRVLDVGINPVTDHAALAGLPALTDLGMERTGLADVAFLRELPALSWFIAHGNRITDLSPMAGRTWRGWGALTQTPTATATVNQPLSPGLRDQLGNVIVPSVLTLPDGAIPLGEQLLFTEPGSYAVPYAETASGSRAKFGGILTVTVTEADEPSPTPPTTQPTEDPTDPGPDTDTDPDEPDDSDDSDTAPEPGDRLPKTGADATGWIAGLAAAMVLGGTALLVARRRTR